MVSELPKQARCILPSSVRAVRVYTLTPSWLDRSRLAVVPTAPPYVGVAGLTRKRRRRVARGGGGVNISRLLISLFHSFSGD